MRRYTDEELALLPEAQRKNIEQNRRSLVRKKIREAGLALPPELVPVPHRLGTGFSDEELAELPDAQRRVIESDRRAKARKRAKKLGLELPKPLRVVNRHRTRAKTPEEKAQRILDRREDNKRASAAYRARNPDRRKEVQIRYRENNREQILDRNKSESYMELTRARVARKKSTDPNYKLRVNISKRILMAVKSYKATKAYKTDELLGCTIPELREHLESLWLVGMSWDNHTLRGWHIDHKTPCSAFDLTDPEQQKACFHYTNLQPLWAIDNIKKGGVRRKASAGTEEIAL